MCRATSTCGAARSPGWPSWWRPPSSARAAVPPPRYRAPRSRRARPQLRLPSRCRAPPVAAPPDVCRRKGRHVLADRRGVRRHGRRALVAEPVDHRPEQDLTIGEIINIPVPSVGTVIRIEGPDYLHLRLGESADLVAIGTPQLANEVVTWQVAEADTAPSAWGLGREWRYADNGDFDAAGRSSPVLAEPNSQRGHVWRAYRAWVEASTTHPELWTQTVVVEWGGTGPCPAEKVEYLPPAGGRARWHDLRARPGHGRRVQQPVVDRRHECRGHSRDRLAPRARAVLGAQLARRVVGSDATAYTLVVVPSRRGSGRPTSPPSSWSQGRRVSAPRMRAPRRHRAGTRRDRLRLEHGGRRGWTPRAHLPVDVRGRTRPRRRLRSQAGRSRRPMPARGPCTAPMAPSISPSRPTPATGSSRSAPTGG